MSDSIFIMLVLAGTSLVVILTAVATAYQLGRQSERHMRSRRLDRLHSALRLDNTEWKVHYTKAHQGLSGEQVNGWMRFRQQGNRVIGEGEDQHGHRWSAEGIAFQNRLVYLYLDRCNAGHEIGSIQIELTADGQSGHGLRSVWCAERGCLSLQPIEFQKAPECDSRDDLSGTTGATDPFLHRNVRRRKATADRGVSLDEHLA